MHKILGLTFILPLILGFFLVVPSIGRPAYAASDCNSSNLGPKYSYSPVPLPAGATSATLDFKGLSPGVSYRVSTPKAGIGPATVNVYSPHDPSNGQSSSGSPANGSGNLSFSLSTSDNTLSGGGNQSLTLEQVTGPNQGNPICGATVQMVQFTPTTCHVNMTGSGTIQQNTPKIDFQESAAPPGDYNMCIGNGQIGQVTVDSSGNSSNMEIDNNFTPGVYNYWLVPKGVTCDMQGSALCKTKFTIVTSGTNSPQDTAPTGGAGSVPSYPAGSPSNAGVIHDCGVETAIGCIPTDPGAFVNKFLKWALGAAGGIALLIMAIGSIQMIAAAGNPEAVKAGRDRFISALVGLLFIIFAVFLLQVIGVDILSIPGFHR